MKYGGILGDIGYEGMEYYKYTQWFSSRALAEEHIKKLKAKRQEKPEKAIKRVVATFN